MDSQTRVKKYEQLRKSIEMENNIDHEFKQEKQASKDILKSFDTTIFKKIDIEENEAKREKTEEAKEKTPLAESFTNEYLDDFMKEVREYNMHKGSRTNEDTEVNLLKQLQEPNRVKRNQYSNMMDSIEEMKSTLSKEDITREIQLLLNESSQEEPPVDFEAVKKSSTIFADEENKEDVNEAEEVNEVVQVETINEDKKEEKEIITKEVNAPEIVERVEKVEGEIIEDKSMDSDSKVIIEHTQQMRAQLKGYEDELNEISSDVSKNNQLLNCILYFLILVLLIVIGVIIYCVYKAGGLHI